MARYLSRTALAVGRANDFAKQSVAADYQRTETLRGDRPVLREEWRNGGLLNHPMAPAIIETDPVSGLRVREEWYAFGERHREDLPAVIERDPQTGIVIGEDHWWHGRPRRPDAGIVSLARNARTQVVTVEVWQRPPEEGATYLWRDA